MKKEPTSNKRELRAYEHTDKTRFNNPPAGVAQYDTDAETKKEYHYDPHLDPTLEWAGKKERTSFAIPTVSLHVHENISPIQVIKPVRKEGGSYQTTLFDTDILRDRKESLEFYKHKKNWSNRLIAGDSLLIMNSLIEKEGMAGKVQMVYIDPPYGITYGSNFQPFVNSSGVKDRDEDLTQEPEMIKAYRDTWELGIHSYLTYMRDRLLLAKELLSESGSVFVQISIDNLHHIREICDEVFGNSNFVTMISYATTTGFPSSNRLSRSGDYLVWYAKDEKNMKYRPLFIEKEFGGRGSSGYTRIELENGNRMSIKDWEKKNGVQFDYHTRPKGSRVFTTADLTSQGEASTEQPFEFEGETYYPKKGNHWKASYPDGMNALKDANRIITTGKNIAYVRYFDDSPFMDLTNLWNDTMGQAQHGSGGKQYVVQTALSVVRRCLLMTTDPGDLVLDITCGSGTTAYLAEEWGRRWITCDTSRIAITLARQRLLTATFDYYRLKYPKQGVSSGFDYEKVPRTTLGSIANKMSPESRDLVDRPIVDKNKVRVSGPFTVEAIPSPTVKPLHEIELPTSETTKQSSWRDELLSTGIIARGGNKIEFTRVDPLSGTRYLQSEAETKEDNPKKAVICFADESHPLDSRAVNNALYEADLIKPSPDMILFCAFQFDPEAAKFIEDVKWPGKTLLKIQMNTDLLTDDLKKNRSSNQSFWIIGQPDVTVEKVDTEDEEELYKVTIRGFDYYNPENGSVESGDAKKIAMWLIDCDYDGLTVNPSQIFFPMAGPNDGWGRLEKTLRAEVDKDLIEMYKGLESIPFVLGGNRKIAVKIIDYRGIESLKVIDIGA